MRASRKIDKRESLRRKRTVPAVFVQDPSTRTGEVHISGAEGMYPRKLVKKVVQEYINRARNHPKGRPDRICITIEKICQPPKKISSLPVVTLKCGSPAGAKTYVWRILAQVGISSRALNTAFSIIGNEKTMRGAALVLAHSGKRVGDDRERGIRASRLGITPTAEQQLSRYLQSHAIDTCTVREALVLSAKVAAHHDIVAELCMSDDPDYTTGYVASSVMGYIRVPHIKKRKSLAGGRVFFLSETADVHALVRYLEKTPVLVTTVGPCAGKVSLNEFLDRHHQ